ncbi:hypothetical protein [Maricaulis salignorans]|uniref:Lipoprotein n=1 Tax=Maricaulis salignorans TaxID=144026 RepID=A0A1G9Q8H5_9PROT|nr:hypothetical protein [Maricaulis salignorans]SDM06767.1 hypothetical protein SAMN04488568_104185 [Maricaulis salignorans]
MTGLVIRLTGAFVLAMVLTACVGSNDAQRMGQNNEVIETYQDFVEWGVDVENGAQVWLSNVTVRLWPGEYLLVFQGSGSSYGRCLNVPLTDQQVQDVRQARWSVNEDALDVLVEVSGQAVVPGLCSGDAQASVPAVSILRLGKSH